MPKEASVRVRPVGRTCAGAPTLSDVPAGVEGSAHIAEVALKTAWLPQSKGSVSAGSAAKGKPDAQLRQIGPAQRKRQPDERAKQPERHERGTDRYRVWRIGVRQMVRARPDEHR